LLSPDWGALVHAHATLERGAMFLGHGLGPEGGTPRAIGGRYRAKVIGNGLRELDGFLLHLIGALAGVRGIALPVRERNTANRIARLRQALGVADPDRARLLALGRTRDCLFHCGGLVRRGDDRRAAALTVGWHGGGTALWRVAVGGRRVPAPTHQQQIIQYYSGVGVSRL
jgi:hypothetical protein